MARSLVLFFMALLACPSAQASLGGTKTSLETDRASMNGAPVTAAPASAYTVYEFTAGARRIREYASPSGAIFAITWVGGRHPDLSVLLGSYFAEYDTMNRALNPAKRRKKFGRVTYSNLTGQNVVVQTFGQMRSARGIAYCPALVPSGVSLNDLH